METIKANTQFGLPVQNIVLDSVQQQYDDTCAIKSQEIIMNAMGFNVTEDSLRSEAYNNGWYSPGMGTPIEDVGKLMEAHGIQVNSQEGASLYNLVSELAKGHPVIVGVDSGELWNPNVDERFEDMIYGNNGVDHALIVNGINFNDDFTGGEVSLIDPGTGDFGIGYDLIQFKDAWDDSGNFMVGIE
ncbi:MAG: C39 family peptidase [Muribaculaceae bacterium]|nr:C39 family peptidase [Muribaculaceae bacterium]